MGTMRKSSYTTSCFKSLVCLLGLALFAVSLLAQETKSGTPTLDDLDKQLSARNAKHAVKLPDAWSCDTPYGHSHERKFPIDGKSDLSVSGSINWAAPRIGNDWAPTATVS